MGHAQRKIDHLYMQPRDKSIVAKAKPAMEKGCTHKDKVMNIFVYGFSKYNKA